MDQILYKNETESITNSSILSKYRIDMMFDEARSVTSECYPATNHIVDPRRVKSVVNGSSSCIDVYDERKPNTQNDVEKRIEKMFTEISNSSEIKHKNEIKIINEFHVKYLGKTPLNKKVKSLHELQEPLKKLCLQSIKNSNLNDYQKSIIQLTNKGIQLKIYDGKNNENELINKLNPFSTIAVWASVKIEFKKMENSHKFAFVPLITNYDNNNNEELYQDISESEYQILKNLIIQFDKPLSIFVIVMRQVNTLNKILVCHGFLCESSQNAILIAAALYKLLIKQINKNKILKNKIVKNRENDTNTEKYENRENGTNTEKYENRKNDTKTEPYENRRNGKYENIRKIELNDTPPPPPPPRRPPRNKIIKTKNDEISSNTRGDILTRVTIPGSSKSLNTTRLSNRYKKQPSTDCNPLIVNSPLGFVEMFKELRLQEGVETIDEILQIVVNIDGMSFNKLKPIYKEFLLKLSLVLTKDEFFQKSQLIMNKQKNKKKKIKKPFFCTKKPFYKICRKKSQNTINNNNNVETTSTDSFLIQTSRDLSKNRKFRKRQKKTSNSGLTNRNRGSSSGYISCSECTYDSCTSCCYCSLGGEGRGGGVGAENNTICSIDSENCIKTNKCYCDKIEKEVKNSRKSLRDFKFTNSPRRFNNRKYIKSRSYDNLNNVNYDLFENQPSSSHHYYYCHPHPHPHPSYSSNKIIYAEIDHDHHHVAFWPFRKPISTCTFIDHHAFNRNNNNNNHCNCNCVNNNIIYPNNMNRYSRYRNSSYCRPTNMESTLGYLP